ncbi:MAG TPA: hypothetical protein VNV35_05150 [Puia sp.]|nr:hypothetical protein [Puia sp.]
MKEFKLTPRGYFTLEVLDEDGFPYLTSRRPGSWCGFTDTKIFMGSRLLLISTFPSIIRSGFKLKFQDLPKPVSLVKYKGRRGLMMGSDLFSVDILLFKKAGYRLYKNDQLCAEVFPIGGIIRRPPYENRVVFQEASDDNLYPLVCLLTYWKG